MSWFFEMVCHATIHRWKNLIRKRNGSFVPDVNTYCLRCGLDKKGEHYTRRG